MKTKIVILLIAGLVIATAMELRFADDTYHVEFKDVHQSLGLNVAYAYPPGVGILSSSKSCLSCHGSNGPWKDESKLIMDILDADTRKSLKQPDGSFVIETERWAQKRLLTVIGWLKEKSAPMPYRNAWLYIDPSTIGTPALSKFAPNWDVNLPMSCRVVGDQLPGYENASITSLPMTIQPMSNAQDAELQLQIMLTMGESVKGNASEGMSGNYFERKVLLKVK